MAVRLGRSPSQLLMPLAFAAHAGSLLVLTGTPVNVIVSEAADEAGVGTLRLLRVRARRPAAARRARSRSSSCSASGCCPRAAPASLPRDFSDHARTLVEQYELEADADDAAEPQARRRGGRDPAALDGDRRDRVPGDGHRQRRSRDPRRAAKRRGHGPERDRARRRATRCSCAATWGALDENLDRSRGARRRPAGARPAPGGAARPRGDEGDSSSSAGWSCCSPRAPCRRPSPGCSPPAPIVLLARAQRRAVLSRRSPGRR